MLAVLLLLLAQAPCAPFETSALCGCKQRIATSCEALRQTHPKLAEQLEHAAMEAAKVEAARKAADTLRTEGQSSPAAPEPPDCKGQLHHIISRPIAQALEKHDTLRGHYTARDPRFVTRAVDEEAHCGYQDWHRKVDEEVIKWLEEYTRATPKQFETFLRQLYNRPDIRAKFPHGF
uniref:Wall-associated protein precursor n=1 Tax=Archangium lipolyticum TaxID=2970465 RepID=UPI002149B3AA|nr:Wall-associated protein precursor [Archangium lipolyticum]